MSCRTLQQDDRDRQNSDADVRAHLVGDQGNVGREVYNFVDKY